MSTPRSGGDPTGYFQQHEAFRPSSSAMFQRSMLGSGLLVSLLDRIDQLLEAHDERRLDAAHLDSSTGQAYAEPETAGSRKPPTPASDAL